MIRFHRWAAACGFIVSVLASMPCRAALIEVDVLNAVMTAGTTGYVDVVIRGTGAKIIGFDYQITIASNQGSEGGNVVFTQQILDAANFPEYAFYQLDTDPTPQSFPANTEAIGGDFLDVGELMVDGEFLIARLNVEHQGGLDESLSEALFTLSVTQALVYNESGALYDNSSPTTSIELGYGTLKIVATPEPATLGGLGLAALVVVRGVKRRRGKTKRLSETDQQ